MIAPSGEKIDVDGRMPPGSIIVFDGRFRHGVDPIGKALTDAGGRIATFAIRVHFKAEDDLPQSIRFFEKAVFGVLARLRGEASGTIDLD